MLPSAGPSIPSTKEAPRREPESHDAEAPTPEQAAQSECLSHVKQLALAALMYCQDYDEKMTPHTRWTAAVGPYMKGPELLQCPVAPQFKVGYAYERLLSFRALGSITRPSETLMLGDSSLGGANPATELTVAKLARRHRNAGNAAFVDGHAKWMQMPQTP
jgi:prepilin-type processing-associated H-X9-DG protein